MNNKQNSPLDGKPQLPVVVIPAYQVDKRLITLVDQLLKEAYPLIVVVNDGSDADCDPIFKSLDKKDHVTVLHHAANLGKGQALKTAFNYVLLEKADNMGVVTVDADGQHLSTDVLKISHNMAKNPDSLCLGFREFKGKIPLRSRIGNVLTKLIFRFLIGKKIMDTQTGLRAIPIGFLPQLLQIKSTRYEFELEILVIACQQKIEIMQIPIETIYEKNNPTSHFNPLFDSIKIYFVFIRFLSASIIASLFDMMIFSIGFFFCEDVFISIVLGRLGGAALNFSMVKTIVFHSKRDVFTELAKYSALVIFLMLISYTLILNLINLLHINPYIAKIGAETLLFLASFGIQRVFIFHSKA
ncbi:MAG: glycosyltransferase [Desulfobacteraceae bacterium]|nr:glycosyltransferase [Desulfobacteraceae bacterium]